MAKLSICVPSRNRQFYFQQTIRALLESTRQDVEFVFADNSDDPATMADFIQEFAGDRRIVFLGSGCSSSSMIDNWERAVAATTGEWVTVIGDDDYVDPDLAGLLARLDDSGAGIEAFDWRKLDYYWPSDTVKRSNIKIQPNSDLVRIPKSRLFDRLFRWKDATCGPTVGYSIYHSAISRALLERMRARFGGRYFEHPTVDYDSSVKVVLEGEHFAYTSRLFSIHGRSPPSSSGMMMAGLEQLNKKNAEFMAELGRDIQDEFDPAIPFDYRLGITGSILQTTRWILRKYDISVDRWEENFARACAQNCYLYSDLEQFQKVATAYKAAIAAWEGGRYLAFFDPTFSPPMEGEAFCGIADDTVYLLDDVSIFDTPKQLYAIASAMFEAPDDMPLWTDKARVAHSLQGFQDEGTAPHLNPIGLCA